MDNKDINLYEVFKNYSYSDLKDMFRKATTKDEKDFYIALADLVLQKKQLEVIGKN